MQLARPTADEAQRLAVLHELDILDSGPEPAFDTLTKLAAKLLGVPISLVTLIDAHQQRLKSRVGVDFGDSPRETSFCAHVVQGHEALVIADTLHDDRFVDNPLVVGEPHIRAYAGVPLLSLDGHALGALCIVDLHARKFTPAELELLEDLADMARREIHHREAALRAKTVAEASARVLRDSEALYRATFDLAGIGISIVGLDGHWLQHNKKLCDILQRSPEELTQLRFQDITHPDDLAADLAQMERLLRGEASCYTLEKRYVRPDGSMVWGSLTVTIVTNDGQPQHFISLLEDITARKHAEAALQQLHQELEQRIADATERLQDLYDNAPCGYYSLDANAKFLHINQTALAWLGCTAADAIGRLGPADFLGEEEQAVFLQGFPLLMAGESVGPIEFTLRARDPGDPTAPTARRISLSASTVLDAQGQFVMSRTIIYDISELDRVRAALQNVSHEQAVMLDNDLVGIARMRGRRLLWQNQAFEHILGYAPGELTDQSIRIMYPDDSSFERVGREAYPLLAAGKFFRTQLPVRRKSGETIWVDLSGAKLGAQHDTSLWMLLDITPMKRHEQEIERLAYHDSLTGLPNRLLLRDRTEQALALAARTQKLLALCYVDLDGFKAVNDGFGHDAGDTLLIEISKRLSTVLRGHDTVARIGGDEFVLLLSQLTAPNDVVPILERLLPCVARPVAVDGQRQAQVSASIGVAFAPADGSDIDSLLAAADKQMYRAKTAGKNQYQGLLDSPPLSEPID